ncbi:MAG: dTDP-4-dehydrorhamnose 3,5-epimerase family protein [Gaiellaceae bacterium]
MTFEELELPGVFELTQEPVKDERGSFARLYDRDELRAHGLELEVAQASVSTNTRRGTLRGLHFQRPPHEETKLVRCLAGSVYDVVADLRDGSSTRLRWLGVELSARKRNAIFIPAGCAHGFLTLEDGCELEYLISAPYEASAAAGVRWNDPALGVEWPFEPSVVSTRDAELPNL